MTAQPSPDLPTRPSHGCQDCNTTCDQRCACPGCTAPTSPDLPDSLQRQTKPAGEDVYRVAAAAYAAAEPYNLDEPPEYPYSAYVAGIATDPQFRAAVDEAVRLTEQRLDRSDDHLVAQLTVQLMDARTDLAAMTARAESAEDLGHNLLAAVYAWLEGASDRMDLYDGRRIIDALCDDFLGRSIEGWLSPLGTLPASTGQTFVEVSKGAGSIGHPVPPIGQFGPPGDHSGRAIDPTQQAVTVRLPGGSAHVPEEHP